MTDPRPPRAVQRGVPLRAGCRTSRTGALGLGVGPGTHGGGDRGVSLAQPYKRAREWLGLCPRQFRSRATNGGRRGQGAPPRPALGSPTPGLRLEQGQVAEQDDGPRRKRVGVVTEACTVQSP